MLASGSRRVRNWVATPGRRVSWATWPSTQISPSRAIHSPIRIATTRTGTGDSAEVSSRAIGGLVVVDGVEPRRRGVPRRVDRLAGRLLRRRDLLHSGLLGGRGRP